MIELKKILVLCLSLSFLCNAFGADVILNEYNAVSGSNFLNGGNAVADSSGGRATDSYFGRVVGNGGDWFELVVITDHLNMCNWKLDINYGTEILELTDNMIWSDLRSGTIITVSEDLQSNVSYNPAAGDWWINVQANDTASGDYITASNFMVNYNSWRLTIRDADDTVVFGPAGEGVSPLSGIGDTEIFRLEATPDELTAPDSLDYDDGKTLSTFGSDNQWGRQNLHQLRIVAAEPSNISLLDPIGSEIIAGGTIYEITWSNAGTVDNVLVEFSIDNGYTWSEVYPPNIGNTGSYDWLVPIIDSEQCKICLTNTSNPNVYDAIDMVFTIYECILDGDLNGDCSINMDDFAIVALYWMQEANPYE